MYVCVCVDTWKINAYTCWNFPGQGPNVREHMNLSCASVGWGGRGGFSHNKRRKNFAFASFKVEIC